MKKRGIYQQLSGNKEKKVASSVRSLKLSMKTPNKTGKKVSILDGKSFKIYTPNNQEGIPFTVTEQSHKGAGYFNKAAKKKLGADMSYNRVKLSFV
jgi:hypothetical protein